MARIDAYVRSLERFGARGMVLQSNQNVVLKFADGDRPAAQSVPHDQLISMVREVAPPAALASIDSGRAAQFAIDGGGTQLQCMVQPQGNTWIVTIEEAAATGSTSARTDLEVPQQFEPDVMGSMVIERTGYEEIDDGFALTSSSFLEEIAKAARAQNASDIYLASNVPPLARIGGVLGPMAGFPAIDQDTLERDLSAAAPADASSASRTGVSATYTAILGKEGKYRVTLFRDATGTGAVLRALPAEAPDPAAVGVPAAVIAWTSGPGGLVLICGGMSSGKSTTRAALTAKVNQTRRCHVVAIERSFEFTHRSHASFVSQRELGDTPLHVILREVDDENPEVVTTPPLEDELSIRQAIRLADNGALVLAEVEAPSVAAGLDALLSHVPAPDRVWVARQLARVFVGGVAQRLTKDARGAFAAAFEVVPASAQLVEAIARGEGIAHGTQRAR
ncbi:MAG: hypothetical protein IPL79_00515 [Myxococcales bacterium]|nr:hypothetical protein [Myxococcales bacterium]